MTNSEDLRRNGILRDYLLLFVRLYGSIHIHFHIRSGGIYINFNIRGKIIVVRGIGLFKSLGTSILNKGHRKNFGTYIHNFNTVHQVVRLIDFGTPGGRRMPFSSPQSIRFSVLKSSQKWHFNGWFHDSFWSNFDSHSYSSPGWSKYCSY